MENKQYLLDTNILIEFVHGNSAVVEHILKVGTFDPMPGVKVENWMEHND
ncbi:MAG: hypothetical protein K6G92_07940 [Bacteroidaceae bacterium]|nr:hypothetical protein [Bacteroidaceae bacterium]